MERLQDDAEPWATLRGRLQDACERDAAQDDPQLASVTVNGNTALACATLFAAGAAAAGEHAADLLEGLCQGIDHGRARRAAGPGGPAALPGRATPLAEAFMMWLSMLFDPGSAGEGSLEE